MHKFQKQTEVRWLIIGPTIRRIFEQWKAMCEFIKDFAKDDKEAAKSSSYKRACAMFIGVKKDVTKATLDFVNTVIPIFEGFFTLFQKTSPTIHMFYDSICHNLIKVMNRFIKPILFDGKYD